MFDSSTTFFQLRVVSPSNTGLKLHHFLLRSFLFWHLQLTIFAVLLLHLCQKGLLRPKRYYKNKIYLSFVEILTDKFVDEHDFFLGYVVAHRYFQNGVTFLDKVRCIVNIFESCKIKTLIV